MGWLVQVEVEWEVGSVTFGGSKISKDLLEVVNNYGTMVKLTKSTKDGGWIGPPSKCPNSMAYKRGAHPNH